MFKQGRRIYELKKRISLILLSGRGGVEASAGWIVVVGLV